MTTTTHYTRTCPGWCDPTEHYDDISDASPDLARGGITSWYAGRRISWSTTEPDDHYVQIQRIDGYGTDPANLGPMERAHVFIGMEAYPEGGHDIAPDDARHLAGALVALADELDKSQE